MRSALLIIGGLEMRTKSRYSSFQYADFFIADSRVDPLRRTSGHCCFIRRRSIDGGYRRLVQAQVHRQLPAMMRKVAEYSIGEYNVSWIFAQDLATGDKAPWLEQMLITRTSQRFSCLSHRILQ